MKTAHRSFLSSVGDFVPPPEYAPIVLTESSAAQFMFIDFTDQETLTIETGGRIAAATDKSGKSRSASASGTRRPYTDTLLGKPCARFEGAQFMDLAGDFTKLHYESDGVSGSYLFIVGEAGIVADPNAYLGYIGNSAAASANKGFTVGFDTRDGTRDRMHVVSLCKGVGGTLLGTSESPAGQVNAQEAYLSESYILPWRTTVNEKIRSRLNNNARTTSASTQAQASGAATYTTQIGGMGNDTFPLVGKISMILWCNRSGWTTQGDTTRAEMMAYFGLT